MLINITGGIATSHPNGFVLKSPHVPLQMNTSWVRYMHILFGLDWSGLCIAGGFAFCLARQIRAPTDMDIFLYGTQNFVEAKARYVIDFLLNKLSTHFAIRDKAEITRAKNVVRIRSGFEFSADIILIPYANIEAVLAGFDIDCCQVAFDGTDLWASESGYNALSTSAMRIDPARSSKKLALRIVKYYQRGIGIHIDNSEVAQLIRRREDFQIYGGKLTFKYTSSSDPDILNANRGLISRKKNNGYTLSTNIDEKNGYGVFKPADPADTIECVYEGPRITPFIDASAEFWLLCSMPSSQLHYSET